MTLLKIYRDVAGMTQAELARRLGTTQQSYARWEAGQSRVPDKALSDLASIFSTTVDKLIERKPENKPKAPSMPILGGSGKFWGHIGVRQPGAMSTACFAISAAEANKVCGALGHYRTPEWLLVHTLSNCVLAVRPKQVRIWLVDDAAEWPGSDWEQTSAWGKGCGMPLEVYKAMAAWADHERGGDAEFNHLPSTLRHEALEAIEHGSFKSKPDELVAALRGTVIHFTDGSRDSFEARRADLLDLFEDLDGVLAPEMIGLTADEDRFTTFFPADAVSMIELPMLELAAALEDMADG